MATGQLKCDMHTHTNWSVYAFSTIKENVEAAHNAGLEMIGSAEHLSRMLRSVSLNELQRVLMFFGELHIWPREWMGVKVLRAAEVDIVDNEGRLFGYDMYVTHNPSGEELDEPINLKDGTFRYLDYVIASVHGTKFVENVPDHDITEAYIGALSDPKVIGLGHVGRSGLPFDTNEVVKATRDAGKLIEINEATFDKLGMASTTCWHVVEACAELGCKIMVSSDAHICTNVGQFEHCISMLDEVGFPRDLIATRDAAAFERAMSAAGLELSE